MISNPAAKIAAGVILVGGLIIAPLLDNSDLNESRSTINSMPAEAPRFQIRRHPGRVTLSGHTTSQRQERDLLQVAKSIYPSSQIVTDFTPLGVVPGFWADVTVQTLYLLAETRDAKAIITAERLDIRGVIDDSLGWQSRLDAIKKVLPAEFTVTTDTLLVDGSVNVLELCERAFRTFNPGPINFEESGTNFRSSAYPRLDRVVALATACNESRILVTGYTDASGNEAVNRNLSLKRANAVADYIANGGIDRARLEVRGLGSTSPIADDSTHYGRSLNRRIEIVLANRD